MRKGKNMLNFKGLSKIGLNLFAVLFCSLFVVVVVMNQPIKMSEGDYGKGYKL